MHDDDDFFEDDTRIRFDEIVADLKPQPWYIKLAASLLIVLVVCVVLVLSVAVLALVAAAVYGIVMLTIHTWEGLLH